ncbi:hypothetical protein LSAT2_001157 [Lamellibrachia satsuma]|nr:hypothetical protein LSAT2_001157 [Lamellibrachia satsuma]
MANVRRLLVLSVVCLLLCQMMSLSEACSKHRCFSGNCGYFCCKARSACSGCKCVDRHGAYYPPLKC